MGKQHQCVAGWKGGRRGSESRMTGKKWRENRQTKEAQRVCSMGLQRYLQRGGRGKCMVGCIVLLLLLLLLHVKVA